MLRGAEPGRLGARRPRPRRPTTCGGPTSSASRPGCRRTPTAGGSRWPASARPKATSPPPSSSSTRPSASTSATTRPTCSRSPPTARGCWPRTATWPRRCDWARRQGLSADDELSYLREYEHVTLARILLAQHVIATRTVALRPPARPAARGRGDGGRIGTVIEILSPAGARADRTSAPLERALHLAEPDGWVRVFVGEGAPMLTLLERLARDRPDWAYLRRVLDASRTGAQPVPAAPPAGRAAPGRPAERPRARRTAAPRRRPGRTRHRPPARGLAQHRAHAHQAHLHQARRQQPSRGRQHGPPAGAADHPPEDHHLTHHMV